MTQSPELVEVTQADIYAAALYWVGAKDRETSVDDLTYFKCNWKHASGMNQCVQAFARHRIASASHEAELVEALEWYKVQALNCRKLSQEGDNARAALDRDGGNMARQALAKVGGAA